MRKAALIVLLAFLCVLVNKPLQARDDRLEGLITDALNNNPQLIASQQKADAAFKQVAVKRSLPDPMFMFGYQNAGFDRITYGEMNDSQWMFTASQMFLYPGKRRLAGETADYEAKVLKSSADFLKKKTTLAVTEQYYDIMYACREQYILSLKNEINAKLEKASLSMYASGMASQEDVIMAQSEKYMILEREEMARQKVESLNAMLSSETGRQVNLTFNMGVEYPATPFPYSLDELIKKAGETSPDVMMQKNMVEAQSRMLQLAEKEALPDVTLNASYMNKGGEFDDMWSLTASLPIPVFYANKQRSQIEGAGLNMAAARKEMEGAKLMAESLIRDNYSMIKASEKLMEIYKKALIPKGRQDIDAVLARFASGKSNSMQIISRLKQPLDFELSYYQQFTSREKAIARINSVTGILDAEGAK
jgi:outer membrane protein, heavy metal efflux system